MELIKVVAGTVGQETVQTVNARELHGFLGSGKVFGAWIVDRIKKYGFTDGIDYTTVLSSSGNNLGGRPAKDYHVSIDMAKELAMVERNEQGRKARLYFIECEKQLKAVAPASALPSYPDALRQLADTVERNAQQAVQIAQQSALIQLQAPAVDFVEKYVEAEGGKTFRTVCKLLGAKELDFRAFLESNRVMYKLNREWTAYDSHIKAGRFVTKTGTTLDGRAFTRVLFTPRGVEWVAKKWAERKPVLTR